jgi:hypothetical protein
MTTIKPLPTPTCARAAPHLPLLDEPAATTDIWVREHVENCAYCQARRAEYRVLDHALRARFGFSSVQSRTTEEIMRQIDDQIATRDHAAPRGPHRRVPSGRSFVSSLVAVASVLALVGLAAVLLGGHLRSGPGAFGPPQYSFPGVRGLFADVSMVSPNEGWALAQVTKTPQGDHSLDDVTFYHYLNGAWTPVSVTASQSFADCGVSGFNGTISMDSATDGWAVARNFNCVSAVFHYTGGAWVEAPMAGLSLYALQALSPTSVWAISNSVGSESNQQSGIVHYDGSTWSPQAIESLPAGSRPWFSGLRMISDSEGWALAALGDDQSTYAVLRLHAGKWAAHSTLSAGQEANFGSLTMLSATDGWVLGQKTVGDASGNTTHVPLKQLLYHYSNGQWHDVSPRITGDGWITLERITMLSSTDGWIVGVQQNAYPGATVNDYQQHTVLLRYQGGQWQQAPAPPTGTPVDAITGFAFTTDGAGWAAGYVNNLPASDTVQDTDVLAGASPELWTYQGGVWTIYHP